jgi:hypothetical protein
MAFGLLKKAKEESVRRIDTAVNSDVVEGEVLRL